MNLRDLINENDCKYGRYYCSTDKKWKCRQGPKQTREGIAEDFDQDREYHGLVMSIAEGEDGFKLTARSPAGKKLGFVEFSYDTDGMIRAEELEVDERYRGQGIARTMYDYAKSLGFTIRRSSEQTPDGAAFWDKNKPGKKIWEQSVAEGLDSLDPFYRQVLLRMKGMPNPGSWLSAEHAYAIQSAMRKKSHDRRAWETEIQMILDLYNQYMG